MEEYNRKFRRFREEFFDPTGKKPLQTKQSSTGEKDSKFQKKSETQYKQQKLDDTTSILACVVASLGLSMDFISLFRLLIIFNCVIILTCTLN